MKVQQGEYDRFHEHFSPKEKVKSTGPLQEYGVAERRVSATLPVQNQVEKERHHQQRSHEPVHMLTAHDFMGDQKDHGSSCIPKDELNQL